MRTQIKRKLAPITRAKLHVLYSKSKEAMRVKRSLFNGWNCVHLRISVAKLGILIRSKNEQISFPIFVVKILISTCLFSIIPCYFVALFTLQDNAGFPCLFEEPLFQKSVAILLPIRGLRLYL